MLPYATRLRIHLAESQAQGVPYEQAWTVARKATRADADTWAPETVAFAKRAFRDAYLNLGHATGIGAIAERDRLTVDYVYVTPERTSRRCGWGGSYCREQGAPWLCPEHAAIIDAIPERCGSHTCRRNAEPDSTYCAKHAYKAEANVRGAEAKAERAAA